MQPERHPTVAALAFDLGNVLVRVDQLKLARLLASHTQADPKEILALTFASSLKADYDSGRLSSREFYQQLMQRLNASLPYEQFCQYWTAIFSPGEGMEMVVSRLQERYPLFMISNTDPLHFEYVSANFPVLRHFRRFILSYQQGCQKPEPGIYQALIATLQIPAAQCLFIDDLPLNVEAARQQGLQAWQFFSAADLIDRLASHGLW
ncbi:MAG: HAD family hydrolase [Desulfobacteraceae bacterium]